MKTRWMKAARVASAVAFVLCLALYVGSFFVGFYRWTPTGAGRERCEWVGAGVFAYYHDAPLLAGPTSGLAVHPYPPPRYAIDFPYAAWDREGLSLRLPFWVPLCLFGVLPSVGIAGRWRERRRASGVGRCARCGYDLRATPERCPECGTACVAVGETRRG